MKLCYFFTYLFNSTDYILEINLHGLTFKYRPSQLRRIIVTGLKGIIHASTQHVYGYMSE